VGSALCPLPYLSRIIIYPNVIEPTMLPECDREPLNDSILGSHSFSLFPPLSTNFGQFLYCFYPDQLMSTPASRDRLTNIIVLHYYSKVSG